MAASTRYLWTSADGAQTIELHDISAGYIVTAGGTTGLVTPSFSLATVDVAGEDGAQVKSVKADAGKPTIGILVHADSREEFRLRIGRLVRAMRPKAGAGTLTVIAPEGDSRSLTCYVKGGMEGDHARSARFGYAWWAFALELYAPDPWWYGPPVNLQFSLGAAPSFFPIFPLRVAPTGVVGRIAVSNDGEEDAFPVWSVTGPGSGLTLRNKTTGKSIALSTILKAGESIVIDTRPTFQSVVGGNGANLFGDLMSDPSMWALVPGVNDVEVLMPNSDANSQVSLSYLPRYAGVIS